jgi:hypothetical protein
MTEPINVTSLFAGLFGGIGATFLWEAFLRPVRERRNVAEVLSAEISLNLQLLAGAHVHAKSDKVPTDFELSTSVFDSVVARVGELPPDIIGDVILLYRFFRRLNSIPKTYEQYVDDLRRTSTDAPYIDLMHSEVQQCIEVFNGHVVKAIERVNRVQPQLLGVAFPWWSVRRWTRKPSQDLDLNMVADSARDAQRQRKELAQAIASRTRPTSSAS